MSRLFIVLISIGVIGSLIGIFCLFFLENPTRVTENTGEQVMNAESIQTEYDATEKKRLEEEATASAEMVQIIETGNTRLCRTLAFTGMQVECSDRITMQNIFASGSGSEACDAVKDATLQADCKNGIILKNAETEENTDLCKTIANDPTLKTQCVTNIEEKIYANMTASGTITTVRCNTLTNEKLKAECLGKIQNEEESLLFRKVIEGNSATACNMLTSEENQNTCKDIVWFRLAMAEYNTTYCKNILDTTQRELCDSNLLSYQIDQIMQEALDTNDMDVCEKLDTPRRLVCRENVLMQRVRESRNPALCAEFVTDRLREICKEITAY